MVEPPSDSCGLMRRMKKNDKLLSVSYSPHYLQTNENNLEQSFLELCTLKTGGYFCNNWILIKTDKER